MNIKSLLLGSAAALVAVSGARAADAVYIPGTETCLKMKGFVRMRVNVSNNASNNNIDLDSLNSSFGPGVFTTSAGSTTTAAINGGTNLGGVFARGMANDDYSAFTTVRGRLDFDAREETELGMLRAFFRVEANGSSLSAAGANNADYRMKNAYIQLGGFTAGVLDSLWTENDGLFTDTDFPVGDITPNRVSYSYAASGFTATLSAEDDGSGDIVPDFVGAIGYEGGWGSANLYGVYDEQQGSSINVRRFGTLGASTAALSAANSAFFAVPDDFSTTFIADITNNNIFDPVFVTGFNGDLNDADDGAFALKANVTLKDLIAPGSQFKIEGSYAFDPTTYTEPTIGGFSNSAIFTPTNGRAIIVGVDSSQNFALSSEWQIGAGYQQTFGKLTAAVSGVYGESFDIKSFQQGVTAANTFSGVSVTNFGSAEYFAVAGNVGYDVTTNLSVLGEVTYREVDLPGVLGSQDGVNGFLELKRTF
ncbi:hypothetical protein ASG43_01250 [Aureimonas sp. Leaf454]|uniref:porin n=1 Tax=Aureimonas sp. Leaf454 TaxID=1736381 RepID=UPI0006F35CAD|nr:porin [Aureimonas sp. Leaf454]KQT54278.1 hypothetical protein ASG43_01250 [Aureimonas sp. Leaf454]